MASTHVPGLSVAVVEDGNYVWAAGFGFADLENNVPASEHTLFRLASISKPLTAVGAMELWECGKLDLDVPVQKYCPSFPQKPAPITTRQVMGHLGGIRHYKSDSQDPEVGNTRHFDNPIQAGLDFFKNDPFVADPGSQFHYSTHGYTVVGCVIEGASGSSYIDYMRQNVSCRLAWTTRKPTIASPSFRTALASTRRQNPAPSRTLISLIRATRFRAVDGFPQRKTWRTSKWQFSTTS